ncbi:phage baseplate plug family protein [Desulfovibrio cuneatus]|uniref:phage baseplate plug family protein n=1 Tax=Desulfovibrio cuneatus TaxID=159728 RepID=UPI0003F7CD67|nr:hypothetical protein [Desulfovibrio cuneatus]
MADYLVPLTPEPQRFSIALAGKTYTLVVRWFAAPEGGWHVDMEDTATGTPLLAGIPLVAGCNLLEQYAHMEFGGELWVTGDLPPSLENLGSGVDVVFSTYA